MSHYAAIINIEPAMSKRFAIVDDGASLGAHLEVQQGGLVVTYDTNGTDIHRNARCTQAVSDSRWNYECAFYGTEALSGSNAVVGLILNSAGNNFCPGDVANSFAYYPGTGECRAGGSLLATVATMAKQRPIRCALDLVANTWAVYAGTLLLYSFALPAGQTWVPAVAIGGTTAYGLSAYFNFGRRKLFNEPLTNFKPGIFVSNTIGASLWLSDIDLRLPSMATPPNQLYEARIKDPEKFSIHQGIQFWPDGKTSRSFSASDIPLDNQDGALDFLLAAQPRGAKITHMVLDLETPGALPIIVATTLVDKIQQPDAGTLTIKQRDVLSRWDVPLQRQMFPPWVDPGAANRPMPITLGVCRNVVPTLVDQNAGSPIYAFHDAALTALGIQRDMGDPLDPTADPPDYTPSGDGRGIIFRTNPTGRPSGDISSSGSSTITPITGTDLLGGVGAMTTASGGAGSMPTGWTHVARPPGHLATITSQWTNAGGGRLQVTLDTWQGLAFNMADYSIDRAACALVAGDRYRIELNVSSFTTTLSKLAGSILRIAAVDSGGVAHLIPSAIWGSFAVGHYTAEFTAAVNAVSIEINIYIEVIGGTVTAPFVTQIDDVTVVQLPSATVVSDLQGINFADYQYEMIEVRGGGTSADWSRADAEAIDAAKPYLFGVHISDVVTVTAGMSAPCDTFGAAMTSDAQGVVRWVLQVKPSTVPDGQIIYQFNRTNMAGLPLGDGDDAPGLTTKAGAKHNWPPLPTDSDFVDDFDPTTGIDAETRTRFKRVSQYQVDATSVPAHVYEFAIDAGELPMLTDNVADTQAQHDSMLDQYEDAINNYRWEGYFDPLNSPLWMCGAVVRVTWERKSDKDRPSATFEPGKNLLIKEFDLYPFAGKIEIIKAWG